MTEDGFGDRPGWVTVEVPRRVAALADRGIRTAIVFVLTAVSGFVAIGLAWRGTDGRTFVPDQIPFIVSAGFGGVALLGTGLVLLVVHLGRRNAAARRARLEAVIRATASVADLISRPSRPSASFNGRRPGSK